MGPLFSSLLFPRWVSIAFSKYLWMNFSVALAQWDFFLLIPKCTFTPWMSWSRALVHALPGVLQCVTTHGCALRRLVISLCRCSHCDCAAPGLFCYCSDVLTPSMYSTHTAAVVAMNNLLTEAKNQSGGGLKEGTEKSCHSYQAGDVVQKWQQGIMLYCLCFFVLSGS